MRSSDELRSAHWDPCYAQTLDLNAIGVKEHAKGLQRIVVVDACVQEGKECYPLMEILQVKISKDDRQNEL